nr:hypothetical protein [uncultured Campylobacter sp.]
MFGWCDGIYRKSVRAVCRHIGTQAIRQIIHYPPQCVSQNRATT